MRIRGTNIVGRWVQVVYDDTGHQDGLCVGIENFGNKESTMRFKIFHPYERDIQIVDRDQIEKVGKRLDTQACSNPGFTGLV